MDADATSDRRLLGLVLAAFLVVAGLAGFDVLSDLREGTSAGHVAVEALIAGVGLIGATAVGRGLLTYVRAAREARAHARRLAGELEASAREVERWRSDAEGAIQGLARAIDAQFERWGLSPAEKEVALLLLKGLSHREIAEARSVGETTARQQARAVYRKAGLAGRHDLAAFFLEDLLLPGPSADR